MITCLGVINKISMKRRYHRDRETLADGGDQFAEGVSHETRVISGTTSVYEIKAALQEDYMQST